MQTITYVLPLRWRDDAGLDELTGYLDRLSKLVAEVVVVDGSDPPLYENHEERWSDLVLHTPPDPRYAFLTGKVNGVLTGIDRATFDHVVVADDDVRHDAASLARTAELLNGADLVWPQNYFEPLPWHARWDTARSLLNRAVSHDYPGTLGVRRSTMLRIGGYDGDVMFENLELRRTIEAFGGRVVTPLDLYVRRLPPTTRHFISQRVRQAYDDLAQPMRLAAFLSTGPAIAAALAGRRWRILGAAALGAAALAETGRRRAGGRSVFPSTASLLAPAWIAERAVTSWLAVWERVVRGGVSYGEARIRSAATSRRVLRERARRKDCGQPSPVQPAAPAVSNVGFVQ